MPRISKKNATKADENANINMTAEEKAHAEKLAKVRSMLEKLQEKNGTGTIMLLGDQPIQQVPVISTGIFPLDLALSIGGLPKGRICEFFGPEGGGKTTVALYCIAACQRAGGVAALMDMEHSLDPHLAHICGVNTNEMVFSQPDHAEQMLDTMQKLIESDTVDLIVVDSVAAMVTKSEIENTLSDTEKVGAVARLMSTTLRRLTGIADSHGVTIIFINQLRQTISSGYSYGPTETTTGGRALKFYSSIRLDVRRVKQIKKGDDVVGHELYIKVVKNKLAPPFKTAHLSLIYGKGIPESMAIADMAIDLGVAKKKGSWITYKGETLGQGRDGVADSLKKSPDLMAEIKNELQERFKKTDEDELMEPVVDEDDEQATETADIEPESIDLELEEAEPKPEAQGQGTAEV